MIMPTAYRLASTEGLTEPPKKAREQLVLQDLKP